MAAVAARAGPGRAPAPAPAPAPPPAAAAPEPTAAAADASSASPVPVATSEGSGSARAVRSRVGRASVACARTTGTAAAVAGAAAGGDPPAAPRARRRRARRRAVGTGAARGVPGRRRRAARALRRPLRRRRVRARPATWPAPTNGGSPSWRAALADPDARAIVMARGGYGLLRLLPFIDTAALQQRPAPIVGFSDGTALLALAASAGRRVDSRPRGHAAGRAVGATISVRCSRGWRRPGRACCSTGWTR